MLRNILSLAVITALGITFWASRTDIIAPSKSAQAASNISKSAPLTSLPGQHAASTNSPAATVSTFGMNASIASANVAFPNQSARDFFPADKAKRGEQIYLTGNNQPIKAVTAEDARVLLLSDGSHYLGASSNDDLNMISAKRDEMDNVIYKYQQTYQSIPVFGRQLVVQISPQDEINLVAGQFEPNIDLTTRPQLSAEQALSTAYVHMDELPLDTPAQLEQPVLMVYTDDTTPPVLAWQVRIEYQTQQSGYHREQLFVDANTGKTINRITMMHSAFTSAVHTMSNQCITQSQIGLPGTLIANNTDAHSTGTAANSGYAYWFYSKMFARDSWDALGKKITNTIHVSFDFGGGCNNDNAYFNGYQLVFGDGTTYLRNPGAAIDIFGHEFTHGVTYTESNLIYQNESGALNEAMSDVMGTGISAWKNSGGSSSANPVGWTTTANDWIMGESAALVVSMKRVMNDPAADGQSRDNYTDRYIGTSDNGGVHINSGIMNLGFYLLSQGGKHPRAKTTNTVTAIGIEKALRIYYYANANLFTTSTNFQNARNLTASAAKTLYGCAVWESVHQSWDAVKAPGTRGTECATTTTTPTPTTPTGTNLALGKATLASSNYNVTSSPVSRATDGNLTTSWLSRTITNVAATEYVQLNLGALKNFTSVNMAWSGSDAAKHVGVWVLKNSTWTLIADVAGTTAISNITFATQNAQYVMITMNSGSLTRWYAVKEITIK